MANKENSESAKKIASVEKEKLSKKSKKNKENFAVRAWKAIKSFFKNSKGDLKKITWPGAKEVLKGTAVTIACIAIIGVVVFLVDLGLTNGLKAIRTAGSNYQSNKTSVSETAESTTSDASAGVTVNEKNEVTVAASAKAAE